MSARRELSSTLKNLKFMQRAMPKEAKEKEEEKRPKVDGDGEFGAILVRKCIVVMEGNPHPGAVKGRMSFQGFNPTIDKLNQEAEEPSKPQASFSVIEKQNGESSNRENDSATQPNDMLEVDHKRKKPEMEGDASSAHTVRNSSADGIHFSSEKNQKVTQKQLKREKLDWNMLRREKAHARRG